MVASLEFSQVLHNWTEVFMQRSMREFVQFSKDSGLSMSQLSTLFRIYHSKACGVSAVGDHLGVTNAAASQMVDRLVQMGLLARSEDPQDRRVRQLTLTPRGRKVVEDSLTARHQWMAQLTGTLTPEEQSAIIAALTILTQAAHRIESSSQSRIDHPQGEQPS
jgi:DNA-binding MarR family transcriptional regulator